MDADAPQAGPGAAESEPTAIPTVSRDAVAAGVRTGSAVLIEALPEEVFATGQSSPQDIYPAR